MLATLSGEGGRLLPWERPDATRAIRSNLGLMRRGVLAMLDRDPVKRPPLTELLTCWTGLLEASTTVGPMPALDCTESLPL